MLTQNHPRHFRSFQYVYPVISRRSGGVSVGINLHSPCNFSCLYCQVLADSARPKPELLNLDILEEELRSVLRMVQDGSLFEEDWFGQTPVDKRRLNDIALSGDGEPTLAEQFDEIVRLAVKVRGSCSPPSTRLVLISNASRFHVKHVAETVDYLMQQGGEIWAKLDAGSGEYFQRIARTTVSYEQVLENILSVAIRHP
ncbi:MAG: radical SAM protein, partial [Thermoguttaceae bacterium]